MSVAELIELLKTMPQDALVCYRCYSEQCLMGADDIDLEILCHPRHDGWVQNARPDMPSRHYVTFPGN